MTVVRAPTDLRRAARAAPPSARVVAGVLGLSGLAKLAGAPPLAAAFEGWGYSQGFMKGVGAAEVASAAGLLAPSTRRLAALGIGGLMVGAAATHLRHDEAPMALPALGVLAAALSLARRPDRG